MKKGWMVRAGEAGRLIDDFEKVGCVAVGWDNMGDLTDVASREEMDERLWEAYQEDNKAQHAKSLEQIYKFRFEIEKGDVVVSYNKTDREYLVGEVTGEYKYEPGIVQDYKNIIPVNWIGKVSRDDLSIESRNSLGAIQTLFSLNEDILGEIKTLLKGETPEGTPLEIADEEIEFDILKLNIIGRANEFIKDKLLKLSWDEMQEFVAGILRAMGYKTKVSSPGPDRGKDIIASPDGLGIQQPRIKIQVKHRLKTRSGIEEINSFLGVLLQNEVGLFVSTGGFSKDAYYKAESAQNQLTLIDLDDLVKLYVQYYESIDPDTKALVPLIKVYWPA